MSTDKRDTSDEAMLHNNGTEFSTTGALSKQDYAKFSNAEIVMKVGEIVRG